MPLLHGPIGTPTQHFLLCLTGQDARGKQTQQELLLAAIAPAAGLSFPEYGKHWSAEIMRAVLFEQPFLLQRSEGPVLEAVQNKEPYIWQALQMINRRARHEDIAGGLKDHHWIMDRYAIDALAYGLVDGCDPDWLEQMDRLYVPAHLNLILKGPAFPRPGKQDINERRLEFQAAVGAQYDALADAFPDLVEVVNFETEIKPGNIAQSMWLIHLKIIRAINSRLGSRFIGLRLDFVQDYYATRQPVEERRHP
jgi:thymidylate kinase